MFANYLKIALRTLLRNKGTSAVNITGLSVGMAACLLLALLVQFQFSYDQFHANKESLYRIYTIAQNKDGEEKIANQPIPCAPALVAEIPEVERATRVDGAGYTSIRAGNSDVNKVFRETPTFTDAPFFTMFSFPFLQGSPDAALKDLNSIVLTKELADKLFGTDAPAVGKSVQVMLEGAYKDFVVSGVIADVPEASSFQLNMVIRFEQRGSYAEQKDRWNAWSHEVYVQLRSGVQPLMLEKKLDAFAEKHFAEDVQDRKQSGVKPNAAGHFMESRLQELSDWHFNTTLERSSPKNFVLALAGVGVFIVLIACINFVNLSVAQSVGRTKEVGVRKALGAGRRTIAVQFLGEALLVVALSLVCSLVLVELLLPLFIAATGLKLTLNIQEHWGFLAVVIPSLAFIGIAAGAYPAFYIARFQVATALKDAVRGASPRRVRSALVVVQFTIAVALIASTVVIWRQTRFLHTKNLGFDREQVVMIPIGNDAKGRDILRKYKSMLQHRTDIASLSGSAKPIGRGLDGSDYSSNSGTNFRGGILKMALLQIDFDYTETMGIQLVAGRTFSEQYIAADTTTSYLVNEAFAREVWSMLPKTEQQQLSNGTGQYSPEALINLPLFQARDTTQMYKIMGIVKDYHFESLRRLIRPAVLFAAPLDDIRYIFVRIKAGNTEETMNALKTSWQQVSPDVPWQGSFLDENIERQYRSQSRLTQLTMIGAGLAIVLSCIGLFALAAMMLAARTKEIGIRKVLGASVASIVGLLSRDFMRLVGIAIVLGTPVAFLFVRSWLQDYAYKIELSAWMFVLGAAMAVGIAFITVAVQAMRAARANPVHSLRSE